MSGSEVSSPSRGQRNGLSEQFVAQSKANIDHPLKISRKRKALRQPSSPLKDLENAALDEFEAEETRDIKRQKSVVLDTAITFVDRSVQLAKNQPKKALGEARTLLENYKKFQESVYVERFTISSSRAYRNRLTSLARKLQCNFPHAHSDIDALNPISGLNGVSQRAVHRGPHTPRSGMSTPRNSKGSSSGRKSAVRQHNRRVTSSSGERRPSAIGDTDVAAFAFHELPDYMPSREDLDLISSSRGLRAEWKGPPLDLAAMTPTEQLSLMHPAEINLASVLRLPVEMYIDSKKRIFAEWAYRHSIGKTFRKTDCQRVCRVDVNKASKLWEAFNREGFFDKKPVKKDTDKNTISFMMSV